MNDGNPCMNSTGILNFLRNVNINTKEKENDNNKKSK